MQLENIGPGKGGHVPNAPVNHTGYLKLHKTICCSLLYFYKSFIFSLILKSKSNYSWQQNCKMEIFINVLLNSTNPVTKIFVITVKGLEPATQPPLV